MDLGLFTLFAKIKSHRGEFFNEMADRWADKGRHTETSARRTSPRQRPIFTWTTSGVSHRSTMSKVVKTRAHLMAARLQLREHNNLTAKFLKGEGNCRSVLGAETTGKTKESPSVPSATSYRVSVSSSHVLRTSRNGDVKNSKSAGYVRLSIQTSLHSLNASGTYKATARPCRNQG